MRVEVIYKLVKGVFQYFCFLDRPKKVGTSWISRKGEILEKGGYEPPYQLCILVQIAETKTASTNFTWLGFVFPYSFVFPYFNSNIFYLFICLVFDDLLQSIYYRMFCSKHSITFDMYLLSRWFHCVDIFYIKFRSCETFIVANSGATLFIDWNTV